MFDLVVSSVVCSLLWKRVFLLYIFSSLLLTLYYSSWFFFNSKIQWILEDDLVFVVCCSLLEIKNLCFIFILLYSLSNSCWLLSFSVFLSVKVVELNMVSLFLLLVPLVVCCCGYFFCLYFFFSLTYYLVFFWFLLIVVLFCCLNGKIQRILQHELIFIVRFVFRSFRFSFVSFVVCCCGHEIFVLS